MALLDEETAGTAFHRQRRNLVVGSITLLFVQVADLHLEPHGTLMGLAISFGKPEVALWFLRVAVLYWAVRYAQYHLAALPTGFLSVVDRREDAKLGKYAIKAVRQQAPEALPELPEAAPGITCTLLPYEFRVVGRSKWRATAQITPTWNVLSYGVHREYRHGKQATIFFSGTRLYRARLYGYLYAIFLTPGFTDYGLPYLIFACPWVVQAYVTIPKLLST